MLPAPFVDHWRNRGLSNESAHAQNPEPPSIATQLPAFLSGELPQAWTYHEHADFPTDKAERDLSSNITTLPRGLAVPINPLPRFGPLILIAEGDEALPGQWGGEKGARGDHWGRFEGWRVLCSPN